MICEVCRREKWEYANPVHQPHRYDETYCGGSSDDVHWKLGYERLLAAQPPPGSPAKSAGAEAGAREALEVCQDIFNDFSADEIKTEPASIRLAWQIGGRVLARPAEEQE